MRTNTWLKLGLTFAVGIGALTGCSSGSKEKPAATAITSAQEPLAIKVMTIHYEDQPPMEGNQAKDYIEKKSNVKLSMELVPAATYDEKLNVTMASLDQYDLILLKSGIKDPKFEKLARQGAFYDLTSLVKGKKNLEQNIPETAWKASSVNQKIYAIPRPQYAYGNGSANVIMRKDWLDRYGLSVPKTIDELTNALRVFRDKDPVGGGKTIPFVTFAAQNDDAKSIFGGMAPIKFAFGMPNNYKVENGKAVYAIETQEYKDYLDWLKLAWNEKLFNKDAALLKNQQNKDKFLAGEAGALVYHVGLLGSSNYDKLKKVDPKAEMVVLPAIEGATGKKGVNQSLGFFGSWVIPSTVAKEKAERIVEFLNAQASPEYEYYRNGGIQGVHSTDIKDGIVSRTSEQEKLGEKEKPSTFLLEWPLDPYNYANSTDPQVNKLQRSILDSFKNIGVLDTFSGLISPTEQKNPDHEKKVDALGLKYVTGQAGWDAVQKEITAWQQTNGNQIGKELLELYQQ
ncbi:Lipoprotein LipO [Paenibacillus allorhizoplanae]|uniref:Lipoprotein LipO n=1 Tax=Paenibacillus allorhizoplanae TaxID=2905648 RepID=A0ABN8GSI6_9BACL|nr:extracellular solute-binding protein [Paenibacillus allorhizoplanae]CAH1217038.1 Lipoprotein LipO [Paenibacillus allorhizoplanae]